ncbi:hypothetical protein KY349_05440 [Candidatus Woesearchaeota archaeon]|jgi:hypothetical protein|nr:hypothetical protein [Candidatus Woesearchaeota archaeon]
MQPKYTKLNEQTPSKYKPREDYIAFTKRVEQALDQRTEQEPDFSPQSSSIDQLITEPEELSMFRHETKVLVAVEQGFPYSICYGTEASDSHKKPICRVNGEFGEIPLELAYLLRTEYGKQENSTICPTCEKSIRNEMVKRYNRKSIVRQAKAALQCPT